VDLESRNDDGQDEDAKEEAATVGNGIDDGVFIELAAGGLEPETADPEQKDWDEKPETGCMAVELRGVEVGDVEGKDGDGDVSAGGAEAAKLLDVGDVVATTAGGGASALTEIFEFGEAFDEGEREEEEDAEAGEPGGDGNPRTSGAGDDADGVQAGEDDDVDDNGSFETERIGEGGDEIDAQPDEEAVRIEKEEVG
jgi:hypothetical protein